MSATCPFWSPVDADGVAVITVTVSVVMQSFLATEVHHEGTAGGGVVGSGLAEGQTDVPEGLRP
jgi:hypothetical protein